MKQQIFFTKTERQRLFLLLTMLSVSFGYAKSLDGNYKRSQSTKFEQSHQMSQSLVIQQNKLSIQNPWGDFDLTLKKKNNKIIAFDSKGYEYFIVVQEGKSLKLLDSDNPNQIFYFTKD